ncbi:hypothetical protein ES703_64271 [subsurface metagenome]
MGIAIAIPTPEKAYATKSIPKLTETKQPRAEIPMNAIPTMSSVLGLNLTVSTPVRRATTTARAEERVWTCPTTPVGAPKVSAISRRKRVITI